MSSPLLMILLRSEMPKMKKKGKKKRRRRTMRLRV
jgi:hypothetical protein